MAAKEEMPFSEPGEPELRRQPRMYWVAMWVLLTVSLVGISGPWLLQPIVSPAGWVPDYPFWKAVVFFLYRPLSVPVYLSSLSFLCVWGAALSLCSLLWRVSERGWIEKAIALIPLGCLFMSPLVVASEYGSVSTRVWPRTLEGYEVFRPSEPEHLLARAVRRAQHRFTLGGHGIDPCEPRLLGWDERDRLLYVTYDYRSDSFWDSYCSREHGALWLYEPATGSRPERFQALPIGIEFSTYGGRTQIRADLLEIESVVPAITAYFERQGLLTDLLISTHGEMVAFVATDWSSLDSAVFILRPAE